MKKLTSFIITLILTIVIFALVVVISMLFQLYPVFMTGFSLAFVSTLFFCAIWFIIHHEMY